MGGAFLPSPFLPLGLRSGWRDTHRKTCPGCQGTPLGLGHPMGDLHSHLPQGGWRHPGDQGAVRPGCPLLLPSFIQRPLISFLSASLSQAVTTGPQIQNIPQLLHTQGPLTHPRSLACPPAPPTGGPGQAPGGVLMRPHFREGGAEAKEACRRPSSKGEAEVVGDLWGPAKQPLSKELLLRSR